MENEDREVLKNLQAAQRSLENLQVILADSDLGNEFVRFEKTLSSFRIDLAKRKEELIEMMTEDI